MSRLSTLAALLLVALWLPATLHCRLEGLGLEGLIGCPTEDAHSERANCTDDGCKTIESGQFSLVKTRANSAGVPLFTCLYVHCLLLSAPPAVEPEMVASRQEEALPRQRTWQFARRAALPARAPDAPNASRA